jgi:hypothetical protein
MGWTRFDEPAIANVYESVRVAGGVRTMLAFSIVASDVHHPIASHRTTSGHDLAPHD